MTDQQWQGTAGTSVQVMDGYVQMVIHDDSDQDDWVISYSPVNARVLAEALFRTACDAEATQGHS